MADKTPTVLQTQPNGAVSTTSKERQHYVKIAIRPEDITGENGAVDAAKLVRILTLLQDNGADSSRNARSSPLYNQCLVRGVSLKQNVQANIFHTLGEAWECAFIVKSYPGALPCALNAVQGNGGFDVTKTAAILPTATGQYDIMICGS